MGLILTRYGELGLKGRNRSQFLRQLRHNIRDCLKQNGLTGEVWDTRARIMVRTDEVERAAEAVRKVFGLVSLSPVIEVPSDLDRIRQEALTLARKLELGAGVTFRVRARRADKTFPYISPEIDRLVGEAIYEELGAPVDLHDPEVTIGVEVRREGTYVYGEVIPGPGGLPLGVEGRVVALMSGGIDSPVAAWLMMKRGCGVIPLHFRQSEESAAKALENCQVLSQWSHGWQIRPIVLDHREAIGDTVEKLRAIGEERWTCIFCKRTMLVRASVIAEELGASALVMGDSLGQVASQTLHNLEVISYGVPKPIFRPLIGMDKTEITALAKSIGTFGPSTRYGDTCPFLPPNPLTRGTVDRLKRVLERLESHGASH